MVVVPPALPAVSAAAADLGEKLSRAIREYQGTHAGVTARDVRHALRFAERNSGVSLRRGAISAFTVGLFLVAAFTYLFVEAATGSGRPDVYVMITFAGTLILGLFLVYLIAQR